MKTSMKHSIRISEIRQRLNEIAGLATDDVTDEIRNEADGLRTELGTVETQYRAALAGEEEAERRAAAEFQNGDGEAAEVRALRGKVHLGAYMSAAIEGRAADGAEAELNAALGLPAGRFPLSMLAPEVRATTNTDAAAMQSTWVDRLFSETAAMRLGITFESVGPGVSAHPVTTAGASAAQRGRTEAAADAAWTVGVTELKPTRNAVRAVFSEEDAARLPNLEEALRRDLSMALMEGVDRAIFLGDDGANENSADITGLTGASIDESTLTQANKVKAPETLAVFAAMVDGKHAASLGDLNVVASVGANTLWLSTIAAAAADTKTIASFMRENGLSWGIRGDIDTNTANGDFGAFVGLSRGINGAGVAAIWDSGAFIRDPYSGAAKGEVALTLSYFWDFGLPRTSNFKRLKFVS